MKRKILLVVNELSVRMLLETNLNDVYDVTALENGYEALSWLQHGNQADMVLADTDMTMINAYEFEQSIKKQTGMESVPVIMFSAASKNTIHSNNINRQPFNLNEIIAKVYIAFGKTTA